MCVIKAPSSKVGFLIYIYFLYELDKNELYFFGTNEYGEAGNGDLKRHVDQLSQVR